MGKIMKNRLFRDNMTGRILGARTSIVDNAMFVFEPALDSSFPDITLDLVPEAPRDAFVEFAMLRKRVAREKTKNEHLSEDDLLRDELFRFAKAHGPLFGYAGKSQCSEGILLESIADWKAAQRVMELALKAEVFSKGEVANAEELDEHFWVELYRDQGCMSFEYVFDAGEAVSNTYRSCLKPPFFERFSTEDATMLLAYWSDGLENPDPGLPAISGNLSARFITRYNVPDRDDPLILREAKIPISTLQGKRPIENEVNSLLKIIAGRHTGGMSLDFRNYYSACETKEEGAYGIVCDCYLSYMWHELAQSLSRSSFRVCANPKCENIFSANADTSSGKQFCSDRCRAQANNLKIDEQNKRAREAFYQAKSHQEIYEAAFGKPVSFKDPEYRKQEERLRKWIADDFSKTKKGKSALKQGADRPD